MEPYYVSLGDGRYESTMHAQGAWNEHEQHMAPVSGILAHELERYRPRPDLRMARLSYEILGLIPGGRFEIATTMLRPGRTIELVQAELVSGGRTAVRATAWRMLRSDTTDLAVLGDDRMPGPADCAERTLNSWPGGYIRSISARVAPGHAPGRGRVWMRTEHPLVDVPFSDTAGLIGLVDTSNGIAVVADPRQVAFPNLDLQVHCYREPEGLWLGVENSVTFGPDGIGLTSTVLHDETGPFGRAEQILTLRRL